MTSVKPGNTLQETVPVMNMSAGSEESKTKTNTERRNAKLFKDGAVINLAKSRFSKLSSRSHINK